MALDGRVPHRTTLMKLTTRCGTAAVDGCNDALLAKAAPCNSGREAAARSSICTAVAERACGCDGSRRCRGAPGNCRRSRTRLRSEPGREPRLIVACYAAALRSAAVRRQHWGSGLARGADTPRPGHESRPGD